MSHSSEYKIYNSLLDVIDANEILEKSGGKLVISHLCDVIKELRLDRIFGVRLLHAHNTLLANERMVENEDDVDTLGPCLVTKPTAGAVNSYANCWKFESNRTIPLEFSLDRAVSIENFRPKTVSKLMDTARSLLIAEKLSHVIGLCIARRTYFSRRPNTEAILIETTDPSVRANIVRYGDPTSFDRERLITTTWIARPGDEETVCKTYCEAGSCVPFSACVRDDEGKHTSESTHTKGEHAHIHYEAEE
jgi:hypothetical protein